MNLKVVKRGVAQYLRNINSENIGIRHKNLLRNLSAGELYEICLKNNDPVDPNTRQNRLTNTGAMASFSGLKTGRSPKDKRIVKDETTEKEIWWEGNTPLTSHSYNLLEERARAYMELKSRLYVVDGYAGWDPRYRIKVRVVCCRAYHALFMRNMLVLPTNKELETQFNKDVDYTIFNAGEFPSSTYIEGVGSETTVALNFTKKHMTILGTQYAGEMKKGVFTIMHYLMPKVNILSLHSSANEGPKGDVSLFFGLSGTGKTTLSADPKRLLIGDDEFCWSDSGIFNIEGGCYAKCANLSREKEPDIYDAIKFGAVLENIQFYDNHSRVVNFNDVSITENTRLSYPLNYIKNAKLPAVAGHPNNIIFLCCDAYGCLPPVSKLSYEQAMYHFISGYTAKVSGTEQGVKEPTSTFSSCFGEAFLPLHPTVYAEMLASKMKKHNSKAWLVNTGWTGGKYGAGRRMDITVTRRILDAIHDGELDNVPTAKLDIFGLEVPTQIRGINSEMLMPQNTWSDKDDYQRTLNILAGEFNRNFKKYESKASKAIISAGPSLH